MTLHQTSFSKLILWLLMHRKSKGIPPKCPQTKPKYRHNYTIINSPRAYTIAKYCKKHSSKSRLKQLYQEKRYIFVLKLRKSDSMHFTLLLYISLELALYDSGATQQPNIPQDGQKKVETSAFLPEQTRALYHAYPTDKAHFYVPEDSVVDDYPIPLAGYHNPLSEIQITSKYGIRDRQMHYGTDFLTEIGDTIYAMYDGIVRQLQTDYDGYGRYVILRHPNGLESLYGHLSKYLVKPDQIVHAGEAIALAGNSGRSTGPHLHLEFGFMGQPINPERLIDFEQGSPHMVEFVFSKATRSKPYRWKPLRMREYVVKAGDTWEGLSKKLRRSPRLLAKLNHMDYNQPLITGQILSY